MSELMSNDDKILTTAATLCRNNLEQIRGKLSAADQCLCVLSDLTRSTRTREKKRWTKRERERETSAVCGSYLIYFINFHLQHIILIAYFSFSLSAWQHLPSTLSGYVIGVFFSPYQMEHGTSSVKWFYWRPTVTYVLRLCHEMFLSESCRTLSDGQVWLRRQWLTVLDYEGCSIDRSCFNHKAEIFASIWVSATSEKQIFWLGRIAE